MTETQHKQLTEAWDEAILTGGGGGDDGEDDDDDGAWLELDMFVAESHSR